MRAARREPGARDLTRSRAAPGRTLAALIAGFALASCGGRAPAAAHLSWVLAPASPVVGPATLTVTPRDARGRAVTGAAMRLEGHMSHPGMTPISADAVERSPGVYVASFAFTMAGDWTLLVTVAPPDGGRLEQRIDVPDVR